ncbi:SAM-dependent methyltransferase [Actinomadura parmotrematis]|uniref:SAM-dependent methyltransferase n=1 Tax=Actinomadura parmotrematis TaxID=2864039 RepID=A0ABS7FSW6_9ACTN|nr:SAM-dependent methyltransferase [Actinomadura parmotrematis]MBW8483500.1 SAM-dependent methyltransferase [Actinomadura parmotrematis]
MSGDRVPAGIDPTVPSAARMYDFYLGGKDNFEIDRIRGEQVAQGFPEVREVARANRAFLGAAVRDAARAGIDQYVDLGAGLPTQGHVHEAARPIRPATKVVYVDVDPIACAHARALLPDDATAVVHADIRTPATVLEDAQVARLIDWDRPVALLLVSVLHFIGEDEDPDGIIGAFTARMAPGSRLILTVASGPDLDADVSALTDAYRGAGTGTGGLRSRARIERFYEGFPLLPPGLVDVREWPGIEAPPATPGAVRLLAGVGEKPAG